jgi:hypothetical protein
MMWTLEDALLVIAMLQEEVRAYGYHIALGGGVLNTGASDKDLDLYFLPLCDNKTPAEPEDLIAHLEYYFEDSMQIRGDGEQYGEDSNSPYHSKVKFCWTDEEEGVVKYRRLDAFVGR